MLRRFLLVVAVLATLSNAMGARAGVRRTPQSRADVSWQFDIRDDRYGNPRGRVFLLAGRRKTLVLPKASSRYRVLERTEYASHDVPAAAVTACTGWWAGQGEDLYVIRRRGQLIVYIRRLDESAPTTAYKRLKVIALPR